MINKRKKEEYIDVLVKEKKEEGEERRRGKRDMNAISGGKSFQAFFLKYLIAKRKKRHELCMG